MEDLNLNNYLNENFEIDEQRLKIDIFLNKLVEIVPDAAPFRNSIKPYEENGKINASIDHLPTEVAQKLAAAFPLLGDE
jgi:hypothetical protein